MFDAEIFSRLKGLSAVLTPSWTWCWMTPLSSPNRYVAHSLITFTFVCLYRNHLSFLTWIFPPRKRRTRSGWLWSEGTAWWCWRPGTAFRRIPILSWSSFSHTTGAGFFLSWRHLFWASIHFSGHLILSGRPDLWIPNVFVFVLNKSRIWRSSTVQCFILAFVLSEKHHKI